MSKKYYRVLADTPIWDAGAILVNDGVEYKGYHAISEVWDSCEYIDEEYLSIPIVENQPDWFERVWPMGKLEKMVFGTKKQAQAAASVMYKGDK